MPPPADEGDDDEDQEEEAPITSRSPERISARSEVTSILKEIRTLLDEVRDGGIDEEGRPRVNVQDRAAAIRASISATRLLASLTGELSISESTIASSPHFKRMLATILDALRPERFAEARQAVIDALERESGASRTEAA